MRAFASLIIAAAALAAPLVCRAVPGQDVAFRKIVLGRDFIAEGAAVADVNRDGKLDVIAGNFWFEAPDWTPHEIAPAQKFDGATGYSNSFFSWAPDVNHDGWPDQITIGLPGDACVWRENPRGKPGPWPVHLIHENACNESPGFYDLLGNRRPVPVFATDGVMAWFEPGKDPAQPWIEHVVSEKNQPGTQRFSHGLGVGDIEGQGRNAIITPQGWYEQPKDPRTGPWKLVPANLGPDCAQMVVYDVNGDGLPDVISSSAHDKGVWWYEQRRGPNGPEFVQHLIDDSISETHSLVLADINGDGLKDIVTGKRFWAHGPHGDVDADAPAMLVWYELLRKGREVTWVKHVIDDDSGVGTQLLVTDVNRDRLPDVVVSNKKGTFVFLQQRVKGGR